MFNHYAKIKRILHNYQDDWYIKKINVETITKNYKGENIHYNHYYRIYDYNDQPIKYCKFQILEKFASIMGMDLLEVEERIKNKY